MKPLGILCTLLAAVPTVQGRGSRDASALQAMEDLAAGRPGVVCWQSRRTGPVRIFCCDLDGANLRQVSPDVPSRDHLAPLISPDGTRVLYYETMTLSDSNYYADHTGDMMIVDASDTDGSSARRLVAGVRTYFECRFARFIDDDRIAYIGGDHHGYVYSLSQDSISKIFDYPYLEFGALPNCQLTHAVDGENRVFTISDPGPNGTLTEEQDYDGCEGNMTGDGLYAYRVKGGWPGHDFVRMRLSSWEEEIFFECPNPRLPADQFFPQLSSCQRFLALGASRDRDEHAHWDSDYDIFIVPIDPATFEETGDAVKYSFSDAMDSYPDVWAGEILPPEEDGPHPDGEPPGAEDAGADDAGTSADEGDEPEPPGDDSGQIPPDEGDEEIVVSGGCQNCSTVPVGPSAVVAMMVVVYRRRRIRDGGGS
jgi:hypothetical protein